jgi:putative CocE/NonD family hydrolase
MKIKTSFPRPVTEIENTFIPMPDGAKLAARIWLPADAEGQPVPAILEYIPYRKSDGTAYRDSIRHPYIAGHGYACVRVDMRGSGDSDGLLLDEYLPQEQDDGVAVIEWLARQPWCTGAAGIIGKSWGGFNGLQIAARRPPALKAIITVCSTDDRYADDVHYMGGCVLGSDMLSWASIMLAYNARPPDPRFVGDRWREMWLDRMEHTPPFVDAWLAHQRRDDFWKHGSVCEEGPFMNGPYGDITCAVYAIGGWADGYTNAIPRLLEGLTCPRKGLIGPWAHTYAESGVPGPAIGFNQECLRWWDYWLKGIDSDIMAEPMLRMWMLDSIPPRTTVREWPGRWVAEPEWPRKNATVQRLYMNNGTLDDSPAASTQLHIVGAQATGLDGGVWCSYGLPGNLPANQRGEDGNSLCFTSAPLDSWVEICGFPQVALTVAADPALAGDWAGNALLAVRLCDVAPGGASARVSWGLLNLTHRNGHERPEPVEPGETYSVTLTLNATAYALPAGHRWRVAVSPTYWPFAWPSPAPVTLSVFTGAGCSLALPVRPPLPSDSALPAFEPPEISTPLGIETLRAPSRQRNIERDLLTGRVRLTDRIDEGCTRLTANGLEVDSLHTDTFTIVEGQPLSAEARSELVMGYRRGEWSVRIETASRMTADAATFRVTNVLDGYEGETRVFSKTWDCTVPRDGV